MKHLVRPFAIAISTCAGLTVSAQASFLMITDSDDDRVLLFDAFDGSLVNENFLLLDELVPAFTGSSFDSASSPINAVQVGNEIWVSDNSEDSIFRVNSSRQVIGRIGGRATEFGGTEGLDDIRGLDQLGNTVFVLNDGTSNSAPGDDTIVTIDATTGLITGNFALRGEAEDILVVGNELFVNNRDGNSTVGNNSDDTIDVYDPAGNYLRTFVDSDGSSEFDSPQQMARSSAGLLVASESTPQGIFEYSLDGVLLDSLLSSSSGALGSLSSIIGVGELGNGNLIFTANNLGVFTYDRVSGDVTQVIGGIDPGYIEATSIPAPGSAPVLAALAVLARRRRRP